jgi:hypothetical protein
MLHEKGYWCMAYSMINVEVPATLFHRLQRLAKYTHRSVEDVLAATIDVALPPDPNLPPELADELAAMALFSDQALWAATASSFSPAQQRRLDQLTTTSDDLPLTATEASELAHLLDEYDRAVLRRARALAILTQRGYEFPERADWSGPLGDEPQNT